VKDKMARTYKYQSSIGMIKDSSQHLFFKRDQTSVDSSVNNMYDCAYSSGDKIFLNGGVAA
jgi:hypothetical protein